MTPDEIKRRLCLNSLGLRKCTDEMGLDIWYTDFNVYNILKVSHTFPFSLDENLYIDIYQFFLNLNFQPKEKITFFTFTICTMLYFRIHGEARYYIYYNDTDIFMYIIPSYSDTFIVVNLTDPNDYILILYSGEKFFKFKKLKEFNASGVHAMYIDPKLFSNHPMYKNTEFKNILCLYYINLKNYVYKQTLNLSNYPSWPENLSEEEIVKNDGYLGSVLRMFMKIFQGYSVYGSNSYFPIVKNFEFNEDAEQTERPKNRERKRYGNKTTMEMLELI